MPTPEHLFDDLVATAPSRPFVTYYDESSGERSELSVASAANWVAKTHFLLTDELGLGVGDTALIALPAHWISVPVLLGCLSAGLALTADGPGAEVAFVTPEKADRATGVADRYAVAPAAAAVGFRDAVPAGLADYVAAVRPQPDAWRTVRSVAGDTDPCLPGLTRAECVARAGERAGELGAGPGARLLSTRDWSGPQDWLDAVLVPLVVGGSLVLVRHADRDLVERRRTQERAGVLLGDDTPGR